MINILRQMTFIVGVMTLKQHLKNITAITALEKKALENLMSIKAQSW